jgi:hypothetical protein
VIKRGQRMGLAATELRAASTRGRCSPSVRPDAATPCRRAHVARV